MPFQLLRSEKFPDLRKFQYTIFHGDITLPSTSEVLEQFRDFNPTAQLRGDAMSVHCLHGSVRPLCAIRLGARFAVFHYEPVDSKKTFYFPLYVDITTHYRSIVSPNKCKEIGSRRLLKEKRSKWSLSSCPLTHCHRFPTSCSRPPALYGCHPAPCGRPLRPSGCSPSLHGPPALYGCPPAVCPPGDPLVPSTVLPESFLCSDPVLECPTAKITPFIRIIVEKVQFDSRWARCDFQLNWLSRKMTVAIFLKWCSLHMVRQANSRRSSVYLSSFFCDPWIECIEWTTGVWSGRMPSPNPGEQW